MVIGKSNTPNLTTLQLRMDQKRADQTSIGLLVSTEDLELVANAVCELAGELAREQEQRRTLHESVSKLWEKVNAL